MVKNNKPRVIRNHYSTYDLVWIVIFMAILLLLGFAVVKYDIVPMKEIQNITTKYNLTIASKVQMSIVDTIYMPKGDAQMLWRTINSYEVSNA